MKMAAIAVAALVILSLAPAAQAQTLPQAALAPADADRAALALALAETLNSDALTMAQLNKMLDQTIPGLAANDPGLAYMEREYPGVLRAVSEAMRPIIVDYMRKQLPVLWQRLSVILAREMTTDELRTALGFYRSPLGARIIKAMGEQSDFTQMLSDALQDPDNKVSESGLRAGVAKGAAGVVGQLAREDIAAMAQFMTTPAGAKIRKITPLIQTESVAWGNQTDPKVQNKIEQAVTAVVEQFVKEHPAQ